MLDDGDWFGHSVAFIGDLDGDGATDLAVGAIGDGDGGPIRGVVYVLFLNTDGTVKSHTKISDTQGGFTGGLDNYDSTTTRLLSVASLGDLDGDGVSDLAVGADMNADARPNPGTVYVVFPLAGKVATLRTRPAGETCSREFFVATYQAPA